MKRLLNLIKQYWKHLLIGFGIGMVIGYAVWFFYFKKPPASTTAFEQTKPAVEAPKVDGPIIKPPVKIVPKNKVADKFPQAQIKDDEEWVDTAIVPPAENGGTMLTKIDTVTGEVSNQFKASEPPWFAFESKNYVGIGAELDTTGKEKGKIYYKRDWLRSKDVHLQTGGTLKIPMNSIEKRAEFIIDANIEYRW